MASPNSVHFEERFSGSPGHPGYLQELEMGRESLPSNLAPTGIVDGSFEVP